MPWRITCKKIEVVLNLEEKFKVELFYKEIMKIQGQQSINTQTVHAHGECDKEDVADNDGRSKQRELRYILTLMGNLGNLSSHKPK